MIRLLPLAVALTASCTLLAQQAAIEVARQPMPPTLRSNKTGAEPERISTPIEAPTSADAASEFGEQVVLVRTAQWEPWHFDASAAGFFTDNVALAPNRVQDFFLKYDVALGYSNRISGPWSMDVSVTQSFVRYDKFDSLDFDLTRADAGISYEASWLGDASLFLRYSFFDITEAGFGNQIMHSHSLAAGVQKIWKVSQGQQLFLGASAEPGLEAVPKVAQRDEYAVFGGWSLRLTDKLSAQLSGRVGYHLTESSSREDWNYVGLVGANYALTDWAKIGVTGSFAWNESNKSIFTYTNVLAGVFVGLNITF